SFLFFFNDTATTEIYTLSLHDALPICYLDLRRNPVRKNLELRHRMAILNLDRKSTRLNLQSLTNLVCRLLLEKKQAIAHSKNQAPSDNELRDAVEAARLFFFFLRKGQPPNSPPFPYPPFFR